MSLALLLPWLKRLWWAVPIAGLVVALVITRATLHGARADLNREKAAMAALQASVSAKTAQAEAEDRQHAEAVSAAQDAITRDRTNALETQLAAARADAANYARRLREAVAERGGGTSHLPAFTEPAGSADGASETAVVDADAVACAEGVAKAQGWQDWWREVSAVPR